MRDSLISNNLKFSIDAGSCTLMDIFESMGRAYVTRRHGPICRRFALPEDPHESGDQIGPSAQYPAKANRHRARSRSQTTPPVCGASLAHHFFLQFRPTRKKKTITTILSQQKIHSSTSTPERPIAYLILLKIFSSILSTETSRGVRYTTNSRTLS
jgi:hypothetical protein